MRRDNPQRTPVYGAALIVAAMMTGLAVTYWSHPSTAVRAIALVLALLAASTGFVMTLRDNPPPGQRGPKRPPDDR